MSGRKLPFSKGDDEARTTNRINGRLEKMRMWAHYLPAFSVVVLFCLSLLQNCLLETLLSFPLHLMTGQHERSCLFKRKSAFEELEKVYLSKNSILTCYSIFESWFYRQFKVGNWLNHANPATSKLVSSWCFTTLWCQYWCNELCNAGGFRAQWMSESFSCTSKDEC